MNLRKYARGKDCQIRIPGICNFNPETTVLCHLNGGGGMKHHDLHAAWGCSDCHDAVDGRRARVHYSREALKLMHLESVIRTQIQLIKAGILK